MRARERCREGVVTVTKQQVIAKIVELISILEEIKSKEGKRTGKVAGIQEAIDDLSGLLADLRQAGKHISSPQVLLAVYKTAERLCSWMSKGN